MKLEMNLQGTEGVLATLRSLPPELVSKRGGPVKTALRKGAQVIRKQAAADLRRFATNIQFHADGAVRLVRLSKPAVTDAMLDHLPRFKRIDYLAIVCPQVTDAGLRNVRSLVNLDTLLLAESGITDTAVEHLRDLKNLQRLDLSDTHITDAGLPHLAGLEQLKTLSLERTVVSDEGLNEIGRASGRGKV